MSRKSSKSKNLDLTLRRTSISEAGNITESEVPLSSLRKEAIDLSADSNSPTTLFVTKDAAMRITEQAISTALDHAWSKLVADGQPTSLEKKGAISKQPKKQTAEKNNKQTRQTKTRTIVETKVDEKEKAKPLSTRPPPKHVHISKPPDKAPKQESVPEKKAEANSAPVIGTNSTNKTNLPQPTKGTKRSSSSPSKSKKTSKTEEGASAHKSEKLIDD